MHTCAVCAMCSPLYYVLDDCFLQFRLAMHLCGAKMPSFCLNSRRPRFLWHIFLVSKCVSARARARSHIPQLFYTFVSSFI